MIAIALLHGRPARARSLDGRWLTSKWASLTLRAPEVLSRQLMRESGVWIVGIVLGLTLLVRRLRAHDVLLLILLLVLILLGLTVLTLVGAVVEVATCLGPSVRCWTGLILRLSAKVVVGGLCTLVVLEDRLREGGRRCGIDARIGGRVLTVIVVQCCARKVQVETIVRVHG